MNNQTEKKEKKGGFWKNIFGGKDKEKEKDKGQKKDKTKNENSAKE